MEGEKHLGKYEIFDQWGYGTETPAGIWRPLDIINNHIAVQGSDKAPKLMEMEKRQAALKLREMVDSIQFKNPTRGRPKGSKNRSTP